MLQRYGTSNNRIKILLQAHGHFQTRTNTLAYLLGASVSNKTVLKLCQKYFFSKVNNLTHHFKEYHFICVKQFVQSTKTV